MNRQDAGMVIQGGTVVTENATVAADIVIKNGLIEGIVAPGTAPPTECSFDATGMHVLPGLVDAHTHLQINFGGIPYRDDYYSGTVAAAFNGTTTIIDFVFPTPGQELASAIESEIQLAQGSAVVDFGLHPCLLPSTPDMETTIRETIDAGFPSFKLFMTYGRHGLMIDDGHLLAAMQAIAKCGGLAGVHAENDAIAEYLTGTFCQQGNVGPEWFPRSKPSFVEVEAVRRAIFLAAQTDCPLYIFHTSAAGSVAEVRTARGRGLPVLAETCPHYLLLDSEFYSRTDGANFIVSPPLRPKAEQAALWAGLSDGTVSVVSTDHAPLNSDQKAAAKSFADTPNGLAGIELTLPLMYTFGVMANRITIQTLVKCMSSRPARIFGLYPRKGALLPGSDADLVVLAPNFRRKVSVKDLHMNVDHSVYEGMELHGWPVLTVLRGQVLVKDGAFCGQRGFGKLLRRKGPDSSIEARRQ